MIEQQMKNEWDAWQRIVRLWPGDINDKKWNKLVQAINEWADERAILRLKQYKEWNK